LGGDVGAEVGSFVRSGLGGEVGVIVGFSDDGRVWEVIGAAIGSGLGGEVGVTVYNPVHVTCSMGSKMPSYSQGFQYFHSKHSGNTLTLRRPTRNAETVLWTRRHPIRFFYFCGTVSHFGPPHMIKVVR
jgi:hypothetical protein